MRRIRGRSYNNPVHPEYLADPFVLATQGGYYAYGTGPSKDDGLLFPVLSSTDLIDWTALGGSLEPLPGGASLTYWAPEIIFDGERYLMYYSVGRGDEGHGLRLATADRPEGPFRDSGVALSARERFTIDPHPFRDDDGRWYLFFAKDFLDGERPGTALAVDELLAFDRMAGNSSTVLRASADWQLFQAQREIYGRVLDWHTLEGPFVVKRNGLYYCFYSGGNWQDRSYGVYYATAEHALGPWQEPGGDGPSLLRSLGDWLVGPGHNSLVVGPDGNDYLAFHAWNEDRTARQMWVERLEWAWSGPRIAALPFPG